jgi:hypothetical protein
VEVEIKLDLPRNQVTQLRLEYWILIGQDKLATLYTIKGQDIFSIEIIPGASNKERNES